MEHELQYIDEPTHLILAWQAPSEEERFRWAVGAIHRTSEAAEFRYYEPGAEFERMNDCRPYAQLERLQYRGYPAFPLRQIVHTEGVMEAFRRRLPPRSRSDFPQYARHFRLPSNTNVSDFALLGLTEAKLPNDGFSIVDPLENVGDVRDLLLEVAGHRHYAGQLSSAPAIGAPVELRAEPHNPRDANAVQILYQGCCLGYINRLQAAGISFLLRHRQTCAWVSRVNGTPEHPRLFIFVRVRPLLEYAA